MQKEFENSNPNPCSPYVGGSIDEVMSEPGEASPAWSVDSIRTPPQRSQQFQRISAGFHESVVPRTPPHHGRRRAHENLHWLLLT